MKERCPFLLISLLLVLLVYPYLLDRPAAEALLALLNSTVVLAAIYAVSDTQRQFVIALAIGGSQLVLSWLDVVSAEPRFEIAQAATTIVFYGYALARTFDYVLRGREVTIDKIYGSIAIYLLMGYTWASCYDLLVKFQPHAFTSATLAGLEPTMAFRELVHFSFVTLTSLGYGDVTPVSDQARSLSFLEAIAGNLYLAVLVSRLVGLYRPGGNEAEP